MVSIHRRGNIWQARLDNGRRYSLKTRLKEVAEIRATELELGAENLRISRRRHWKRNVLGATTFLYIVKAQPSGHVKVGIAKNLKNRLADLQSSNFEELTVLRTLPFLNIYRARAKEREIHQKWERFWVRGEWFCFGTPQAIPLRPSNQVTDNK
jgi:predicted GIY-YIG superfamily endonuclease